MAIVIEQRKKKINWFVVFLVVLIIGGIGLLIYYLFFASPPLIQAVAPVNLQSLKDISSVNLKFGDVTDNPIYQILKQYINPIQISTSTVGRSNPFLPLH